MAKLTVVVQQGLLGAAEVWEVVVGRVLCAAEIFQGLQGLRGAPCQRTVSGCESLQVSLSLQLDWIPVHRVRTYAQQREHVPSAHSDTVRVPLMVGLGSYRYYSRTYY